jgi:hypothetical protein
MIAKDIKDLMHTEPFRPIRIVLDTQRTFVVNHVDYIAVSPDGQSLAFWDDQGHARFLNAQQIKLVEPVPHPPTGAGN